MKRGTRELTLIVLLGACATAPPARGGDPACSAGDDAAPPLIRVAVAQRIDADAAPVPRNDAERIAFRQLYETLVHVDCAGTVLPALAASWTSQQQGRVWQFRLRSNARFSDGSPADAQAVQESWQVNAERAPAAHAQIAAISAAGEHELRVELHSGMADPAFFAQPAFAVVRRSPTALPVGTGAFVMDGFDAARGVLRLSARNTPSRTIELHTFADDDARRALDSGMDALVTADAATLDYARALPGWNAVPVTWNRTYVLASHVPADSTPPPADALAALARDAVRADARAASRASACLPVARTSPRNNGAAPLRAFAYPRSDAVARSIAERLVALAWPASRAPGWLQSLLPRSASDAPVARALDGSQIANALRTDDGSVYILPLPRVAHGECNSQFSGDTLLNALNASALLVTPLVDTRAYLIHRAGIGRVLIDADGAIRFMVPSP